MTTHTCSRRFGRRVQQTVLGAASITLIAGGLISEAEATEPCGDFGECKVLVEINSSDGDIGFHWLADADDLRGIRINDAEGKLVYRNRTHGPLRDQRLTETFGESSEPVCREALKEDEDDVVVTIQEFAERWPDGPYRITGRAHRGEKLSGQTPLTYHLPAAPIDVAFTAGTISWMGGTDLGECATESELYTLVDGGVLPVHPMFVQVVAWEVVLELEDGSGMKFSARLPAGQLSVTVPTEFLIAVGPNSLAKVEVGAIGGDPAANDDDNATFTELGDICLNEVGDGCEEDEEEQEEEEE